jgi:hypothetical protein
VFGSKKAFTIDSNSPLVDLSVPELGYINVFDYTTPAKLKLVGTVWSFRRSARSSVYGVHRNVVEEHSCGWFRPPTTVWHRARLMSLGDAIRGNFPTIVEARTMLASGQTDVMAFDRHFAIAKPQAENPLYTVFYNNTKVAVIGKKLRVLPMWRKPWFEKLLSRHTYLLG